MTRPTRYALLTVDTEALPRRADSDHVKKLIWGEHDKGTAGIREMVQIGKEFGARHVFFVDVCAAYDYGSEIDAVIRWLDQAGQDVQLHAHPEYLPEAFWRAHGFRYRPRFMNQFDLPKAEFTLRYFGARIAAVTGKPILAFRAGSFRWNVHTLQALKAVGIPLSFNNSTKAWLDGVCPYAEPCNRPFSWSNGVIEVPVSERLILPFAPHLGWERLSFPYTNRFFMPPWRRIWPFRLGIDDSFLVVLLHSWSFLHWDEREQAQYCDDHRIEQYRRFVKNLVQAYEVITTDDLLDLCSRGKISPYQKVVDLALTELNVPQPNGKALRNA